MTHPKVFDMDGQEQPWSYAVDKYGVAYRRGTPNEDGEIYRLISLHEKTGHSSLITQVLDENGQPIDQMGVAFYWPDAPNPPDPPTTLLAHDWYPNFTWGVTNLNGDVGPGMGTGAYHGEGEGGPHAVWVRDPDIPSDICEKLGMLAGTFHDHFDQKFQRVSGGVVDLPDPDDFEIVDTIVSEGEDSNMLYLAYPADISLNTDVHAWSDAEDDLDTTPLVAWDFGGETYARGGVCADFGGTDPRTYSLFAYHLQVGVGTPITPTVSYEFQALGIATKKHVTVVIDWVDDDNGNGDDDSWTMTVERKPGIPLLIGKMPRAGIQVTVTDPGGHKVIVASGSKVEHGVGGWEVNTYAIGTYTIEFEGESFQVAVEVQTVTCTFEEGPGPTPQARLVTDWRDREDAESLLEALEEQYPGTFSLEED